MVFTKQVIALIALRRAVQQVIGRAILDSARLVTQ